MNNHIQHDVDALIQDIRAHRVKADFSEDEFCSIMEEYRAAWAAYSEEQSLGNAKRLFKANCACYFTMVALGAVYKREAQLISDAVKTLGSVEANVDLVEIHDQEKVSSMRKGVELANSVNECLDTHSIPVAN